MKELGENFKEFCNSLNESKASAKFRSEKYFLRAEESLPNFKHGGSILVRPELDLDTVKFNFSKGISFAKGDIKESSYEEVLKSSKYFNNIVFNSWFGSCNDGFAEKVLFLKLDKNDANISLEFPNKHFCANLFVLAPKGVKSSVFIKKTSKKSDKKNYAGLNIRVVAEEGSNVRIFTVQDLDASSSLFEERSAFILKDASVSWVDLSVGSSYEGTNVLSRLVGEGAKSNTKFLYAAKGKQRFDIYTSSVHEEKNTESDILTRGIIGGSAKALSRGLVFIDQNASGSKGYEKQDAMILSDGAEADAIPNLEINNHDVKCSHGSSVGQVDPEKLFYLMAKGLSESEAKRLIIEGYFSPVMEGFSALERENIEKAIAAVVGGGM
jgi:Fe-S cluster assembly protein SufD